MSRAGYLIAASFCMLLSLIQPGCTGNRKPVRLQVVVSIEPLSYFVRRIGGKEVSVSVMVPPGGNPHSYEPTPRQMTALGEAALFVKAGSGVEFELDWMQKFVSLNPGLRICNASDSVRLIPISHFDGEAGEKSHHGRYDPHYWLSPANGITIAGNVEKALSEADPAHRSLYEANAAALVGELQSLRSEISGKLAGVKNRRFLVFHPAWGYYAEAFGLEQIAAEEEGKTLTPQQMIRVIDKARAERIKVIFVSPQFSTVQAEAIARDIGGATGMVDPLSGDYEENLRKATAAFQKEMQ
jgi:zinc transport system substrate-binding protein